jgi:hypothetical protein
MEVLNAFIIKNGFPLVVEPREGFGSMKFFLNEEQVREYTKDGDVLFQEFPGNPEDIFKYKDLHKKGIPLFFQVPEVTQYTTQVIIHPDGSLFKVFFTINTMVFGRNEYIRELFNEDVVKLTHKFAKAFYENGWYGPLNIQLKPDQKGNWKIFELKARHSESTPIACF